MKEIRILLTEQTFTELCKRGAVEYKMSYFNTLEIRITKNDILDLSSGDIITKEVDGQEFKLALQDIGYDRIAAIIKRSPVYGN